MILEAPERRGDELRARIESAAEAAPRIDTLLIDNQVGLDDPGDALPLEALRRAFVEDMGGDVDWQAYFDRMWRPIEGLLEAG